MARKKEELTELEGLVTPEAEDGAEKDAGASDETKETEETARKADDNRVDYVLPRYILSSDKYVTVTHNGVNYQIETGKSVRVPKGVKEILDDAIERKMQAQGEEEKLIEKAVQL